MSLKLTGEEMVIYMRLRHVALKSGSKYMWRAFLARYYGGKKTLPSIDEIERLMHIVRMNEVSLPKAMREQSRKWLELYNKYLT